jgi:hypothetical protein
MSNEKNNISVSEYIEMLYAKYLIEIKNITTYNNITENDIDYFYKKIYKMNLNKQCLKYKFTEKLNLLKYRDKDLKSLVNKFLTNNYDKKNNILNLFFNKDDSVLSIFYRFKFKNYYFNKIKSDFKLIKPDELLYDRFKMFNDILNVECNISDNFESYDKIYIDYEISYTDKNEIMDYVSKFFPLENVERTVYLKTKYKNIYKLDSIIVEFLLDKVIILNKNDENSDVILVFKQNYDQHDITIGNVDNYNQEQIKNILEEKTEDYIVKVSPKTVIENNCLIGFNVYKTPLTKKTRKIYDMVDANTKLTNKLLKINNVIEEEFNNLLTK